MLRTPFQHDGRVFSSTNYKHAAVFVVVKVSHVTLTFSSHTINRLSSLTYFGTLPHPSVLPSAFRVGPNRRFWVSDSWLAESLLNVAPLTPPTLMFGVQGVGVGRLRGCGIRV